MKMDDKDDTVVSGLGQLLGYMRQVLREQLDRRFVIGLLMTGVDLSVWLCDRSGVLGMLRPIDINKDATKFIHVVAALSTLPPENLGFDTTMRLYRPLFGDDVAVYDPKITLEDYQDNLYQSQWVIEMPTKREMKVFAGKTDPVQVEDHSPTTGVEGTSLRGHNDPPKRERFIAFRTLSVAQSEVMCSRATIVWEVVKEDELKGAMQPVADERKRLADAWKKVAEAREELKSAKSSTGSVATRTRAENRALNALKTAEVEAQEADKALAASLKEKVSTTNTDASAIRLPTTYVLKQSWRPDLEDAVCEGEYYAEAGDIPQLGKLYSFKDVPATPGRDEAADTAEFVRRNLGYISRTDLAGGYGTKRNADEMEDLNGRDFTLRIRVVDNAKQFDLGAKATEQRAPVFRVQHRLLMETFGWPLKTAQDPLEMLTVVCDCVEVHKELYYKKGILHGDISPGNMLITMSSLGQARGALIDFDNAKQAKSWCDAPSAKPVDEKHVPIWSSVLQAGYQLTLDDDVMISLLRKVGRNCLDYVQTLLALRPDLRKQEAITQKDLNLYFETEKGPDFNSREVRKGTRNATLPFASYEVLKQRPVITAHASSNLIVVHVAVQDMEAVFWVVVYFCLTRGGPGGKRRLEFLRLPETEEERKLHHIVFCLFDADDIKTLSHSKWRVFEANGVQFLSDIVPLFHPYFEDLKPLIRAWWQTLVLAYKFRDFDGIHDKFLTPLKETIARLEHLQSKASLSIPSDPDGEPKRRGEDRLSVMRLIAPAAVEHASELEMTWPTPGADKASKTASLTHNILHPGRAGSMPSGIGPVVSSSRVAVISSLSKPRKKRKLRK